VVCRLSIVVDGQPIVRADVGSPSEQPDDGDRMKAGFSDGLKRAAVKFGIGRFLYRLPKTWVEYDPAKKQIVRSPTLPAWAMPAKRQPAVPATVTNERAKELQRLLQGNRSIDPAKFLANLQVRRLSEVPAARFGEALATLNYSGPRKLDHRLS